jgi:hypothetical protein
MFFLRPILKLAIHAAALAGVASGGPPASNTADSTTITADNTAITADAT